MSEPVNDDQLRALLADAHRDDAPPAFSALTTRKPRKRRPVAVWLLPVAAAVAILLLWARPRPPAPPPELVRIEWKDPLAFLLEPPGNVVLGSVPQFDNGGDLP